jgi:predicted dehydrogenase
VLLDVIHEIDYAGWIFGWPEELQARLRNTGRLGIASEEMAELWWETEAGVQVSVALDYLTKPSRRSMTACGEHGTIEWDGIAGTVTLALGDGEADRQTFDQTGTEMFQSQLGALIDALNGSDNTGLATGDEGVKALAVCDAARRASDRGQREMVLYQ